MAGVQDQLEAREKKTQAGINQTYDTGLAAQKQGLLNAYNANTAAQQQVGQKIAQDYGTAKQDVGIQQARNANNLTQFANIRGVNTQAGSQHQLNLGNAAARANATVDFAQQQAMQENERQKALMTTNYNNQVAAALADNDYKRAAALLDDYNNQKKWQDQQAAVLASYGNFDPYAAMYGQDAANGMQKVWQAQNPEVAYRTGAIDAETYKQITGQYPRGYTPPVYGGGGYYWGEGGGDDGDGKKDGPLVQNKGQRRPTKGSTTATPADYAKAQQAKQMTLPGALTTYWNNLADASRYGVILPH